MIPVQRSDQYLGVCYRNKRRMLLFRAERPKLTHIGVMALIDMRRRVTMPYPAYMLLYNSLIAVHLEKKAKWN